MSFKNLKKTTTNFWTMYLNSIKYFLIQRGMMADKNVTQSFKPNTYHTTKIGLG